MASRTPSTKASKAASKAGSKSGKSGKTDKSKSSKKPSSINSIDWKNYVNSRVINAYTWSAHVIYLVEFNSEHIKYLDVFNQTAARGQRACINIISYDTLIQSLHRYKNETANEDLHPDLRAIYPAAAEEAMKFLLKKPLPEVPIEILAKLIKLEILRLKLNHITLMEKKRRLRLEIKEEFNEMLDDPKKCVAQSIKSHGKPTAVATATNFGSEIEPKKETSTKLHKRGEEWKQWDDIDDSPKSGPNLYIVLSMFYNPKLIIELIRNDIPVIGIIQMRRDNDTLDNISELKDRTQSAAFIRRSNSIHNFWHNYAELIKVPKDYAKLENTAFVTFKTPVFEMGSKKNVSETDQLALYNDLTYAIYEIEDILRQYATFLKSMRILRTRQPRQPLSKFQVYNGMLKLIPNECITIPIILNCMLEQVAAIVDTPTAKSSVKQSGNITSTGSQDSNSSSNLPTILSYYGKFRSKYLRIFEKIAKETESLLQTHREDQVQTKPITIEYGNEIKYKSFHLDHLNLEEITLNVLYYQIVAALWRSIPCLPNDEAILYDCHITKLLQETPNKTIDKDVLWHYLHFKVFGKMVCTSHRTFQFATESSRNIDDTNVSSTGKQFNLGSVYKLNPLNKNYRAKTLTLNDILFSNDLAKLFSRFDTDLKSVPNIFDKKHYTSYERLNSSVMLQKLYKASLKFNCIDYHHFEFTDCLLIQFHNSYPKNGIQSDDWEVFLPSAVCFRDFVSYVYNEHQEWIKEYETRYKQMCKVEERNEAKRLHMQKFTEELLKIAPDTLFSESLQIVPEVTDYLLPGSIKKQVYDQKQEEKETMQSSKTHGKKSETSSGTSKQKKKDKKKERKSSPTNKSAKLSPQQQIESYLFPAYPLDSPFHKITLPVYPADENEPYKFIGYDLGTSRVQFNGHTQYFHSSDQSFLKIETVQKTCAEEKSLAIEIHKHGHSLYLYSSATPDPSLLHSKTFMFHLAVDSGVVMTFSTSKELKLRDHHSKSQSKISVIKRDLQSALSDSIPSTVASRHRLSKITESITNETNPVLSIKPPLLPEIVSNSNIDAASTKDILLEIYDKYQTDEKSKVDEKRIEIGSNLKVPKLDDKQPEINNRFRQRMLEEKRLHAFLKDIDVLKPKEVSESTFLKRKHQFLTQLEEARTKRSACFKIHSSKLHTYRYIKRIKPYITVNIRGIVKKILLKPIITYSLINRVVKASSKQTFEKWKNISTRFKESTIPLYFNLNCSWPNGLCVKTVPTSDDFMPYYIRQSFLPTQGAAGYDELSRCFLSNGQLLIFYQGGRMKILCGDSTIYNCHVDGFKPISLKPKFLKPCHNRMTTLTYKFRKILKQKVHIRKHLINSQRPLRIPYTRRMYLKKQKYCFRIASKLFKTFPDRTPIPEYNVVTAEGDFVSVRNNKICGVKTKLFVDVTTDLSHNEVYIEREDSTTTFLHGENGTMNVLFPDGTRITTWFEIEEQEIVINFTDDEYQQLLMILGKERLQNVLLGNIDDSTSDSDGEDLTFEPFVSVILVCTFEHPKYARVNIRNGVEFNTEISMLDDVTINLDRLGQYVCDIDDSTKLSLLSSMICFEQVTCCSCFTKSRSIINYRPFVSQVNSSETGCYVSNMNTAGHEIFIDFDGNDVSDSAETDITEDENHLCKSYIDNKTIDKRFFLVKRQLNGSEFISDDEQKQYLTDCIARKFSSIYNDTEMDHAIIATYGLTKTYANNWLQPLANMLPMYLKRKDTLPSTYYPNSWLSPFHDRQSSLINMNLYNSCCMDAMYSKESLPPIAAHTHRAPIAIIRRRFVNLTICHDQSIKTNPLFSNQPDGLTKVYRALKHPPHKPIFRQSSALDFRDRWLRQQNEADYYRQLLKKRHVPKYFSKNMATIMFDVECQSNTPLSSKTDPNSSNPHASIASKTSTRLSNAPEDYKIDLVEIAKKWHKSGYIRYQPQFKKFFSIGTQTDFVNICPVEEGMPEVNDETSEFCVCRKKSKIPISNQRLRLIERKAHSTMNIVDEGLIKAQSLHRPVTVCATGTRPGIHPMILQMSPKESFFNRKSDQIKETPRPSLKPATVQISQDFEGITQIKYIEHRSEVIPTLFSNSRQIDVISDNEASVRLTRSVASGNTEYSEPI